MYLVSRALAFLDVWEEPWTIVHTDGMVYHAQEKENPKVSGCQ